MDKKTKSTKTKAEISPDSKTKENVEALASMSKKYEDILESQIKLLYVKIVNFISVSQIPLVHVNAVLDLVKKELIEQLKAGYTEKQ